ncbi:hypothetical protein FS749_016629 [Ceratobasidium sp. UAMH 11750]|nr:hypothetical protein FS749_016629 [Ceratobasidium sp. UAMH 11750]
MALDPYVRKTPLRHTCRVAPVEQRGTISTADAETTSPSFRMPRTKVDPPSSSPAPIRESQPRPNSPTTTEHGTQPYHALYDTPPEGTQPIDLKRSEHLRAKSARGRDALEYQHRSKPAVSKSNPAATEPTAAGVESHLTTATRTTGSQRAKGPAKRRALRFDGESSSDEPGRMSGSESDEKLKPRKRRNAGSKAHSPAPRPPGRGKIARVSQAADQRVVLEPDAARELGDLIGINVSTATPAALKDTLRTLSNPNSMQVGPSERYPQVRGQATAVLPSLNKKVTYHRERLLELARPRPSESPNTDTRPAKRSRTETRGKSADEEMLDPDADMPQPELPGLPRIPPLHSSQPLPSTSSTQRAIVNAFTSQRDLPHTTSGPNFRPTPIPQTKGSFTRFAPGLRYPSSDPRPPSPEHHVPSLDSRPPSPDPRPFSPDPRPFSPDPRTSSPEPPHANVNSRANRQPYDTSLTPELTRARPTLATRSTAPSTSSRKPPPDPNTATELETESEPQLKPKPRRWRRSKKKTPTGNESPEPASQPSDQRRQHPAGERDARDASSTQRRDAYDVLVRLNELLDDEAGPNDKEIDSLLRWAADLALRRQPGQHPSSHAQAGPSSSRMQPNPSSLHAQPGPLSSCTQPGPRSSCARPGPVPDHDRRRPARDTNSSDDNSEGGAGTGEETDVEANDADDPIVPERSGLSRYPGTRGKVASRAIRLLLSTAVRKGVYQGQDMCGKWARNAYRRAWKKYCPHIPYKECPLDLLQTIVIRISNLRTEVKKRIRMVIRYLFGFVMGLSEEAMSTNRQLVARLGHNTFHCRDLAYFWYPDSFLIRDEEHVDNLIEEGLPLPAVAFVLTMMQECIQEWQTGYFKPRDLNVSTQRSIFDAHLQGLIEYRRPARKRLAKFQVDWFSAGMEYAGIEIHRYEDQDHYCQSITRSANVRPDTPEESEPEYDESGRLTAQSKGKHKAR